MGLLTLVVLGLIIYFFVKVQGHDDTLRRLNQRMEDLEAQLRRIHVKIVNPMAVFKEEEPPAPKPVVQEPPKLAPAPIPAPAPLPPQTPIPPYKAPSVPASSSYRTPVLPPDPTKSAWSDFSMPAIDWEQFMGVKLFAWIGGFALFLGMAFFVKYSIDHNLISPLMRVMIGFVAGVGVIAGGLSMRNKGYDVTVQTLCAAGISILYADIYACRSFYSFLSVEVAFVMMILVTVTSFFLAVRLDSRYVAILGLVGGFLTPVLLSTGVDRPMALFSYILMLDIGLAAVTIRKRWGFLLGLSAVATFVMEAGWTMKFFTPEKAWLAIGIYLTFGVFFLIISSLAAKNGANDSTFQEPADYMPLLSMGFGGYLLSFPALGMHPGVIFTLLFSNLALLGWQAIRHSESRYPYALGCVGAFILLAVWTVRYMTTPMALLSAGLYLGLCLFTFFVSSHAQKKMAPEKTVQNMANVMPLASFGLLFYFLTLPDLGSRPVLVFSLLFVLVAMLAWRALSGEGSALAYGIGGLVGFVVLGAWTASYMRPEKIYLLSGLVLAYCVFHLLISRVSEAQGDSNPALHSPADYLPLGSMGFVWYMLQIPTLGHRPGIVLTLLLILGGLSAYRALKRPEARAAYGIGGAFSFFLLAFWTVQYMRSSLLLWGLGYYMAFAVVHTLYPILYQRLRTSTKPMLAGFVAPMVSLVLILIAMTASDLLSFLLWPFVLVLGMLGVAMAWFAGSILATGSTVFLVMACLGVWLFRLPDPSGLSASITLLAGFTGIFFAWTLLVTRSKSLFSGNASLSKAGEIDPREAENLPALTALMPFALLMMVCVRLPLPNPSDVFLLVLFLDILLLALTRYRKMGLLAPVALAGTVFVEIFWLANNTPLANPQLTLLWAVGYYALFMFFPFMFRRHLKGLSAWQVSALSGLVQWPMVWEAVRQITGKSMMASVPLFFAIPSLLCLMSVLTHEKNEERISKLAWFGGITLLFVTLIIPIQFDKEWLTLGWALEGAALLWLFRRVPHDGLKLWGLGLLGISFVRLALNPAVLAYHPRSAIPIFNWYLWVYGASVISYYLGSYWIKEDASLKSTLNAAGTIVAFLLLNIEIADYFSTGSTITFNFSGNLGQDMTYSLSWAVFSIILLVAGIYKKSIGARYASIGLLTVTLGKLFLHDLWRLGGLYRVASFVGLAVILILVSFLYQKFLGSEEKSGGAS